MIRTWKNFKGKEKRMVQYVEIYEDQKEIGSLWFDKRKEKPHQSKNPETRYEKNIEK